MGPPGFGVFLYTDFFFWYKMQNARQKQKILPKEGKSTM